MVRTRISMFTRTSIQVLMATLLQGVDRIGDMTSERLPGIDRRCSIQRHRAFRGVYRLLVPSVLLKFETVLPCKSHLALCVRSRKALNEIRLQRATDCSLYRDTLGHLLPSHMVFQGRCDFVFRAFGRADCDRDRLFGSVLAQKVTDTWPL